MSAVLSTPLKKTLRNHNPAEILCRASPGRESQTDHLEEPARCRGKPGSLCPTRSICGAEASLAQFRVAPGEQSTDPARSWRHHHHRARPGSPLPGQPAGGGVGGKPARPPSANYNSQDAPQRQSALPSAALWELPLRCTLGFVVPRPPGSPRPITGPPAEDSPPHDAARQGDAEHGAPPETVAVPGAAGERSAAAGGPRAQAVGHVRERRGRRGRPGRGRRRSGRRRGCGRRGLRLGARRHRPGLAAARRRAAHRHHRGAAEEPRPVRRLPPGLPGRRGHQGSAAETGVPAHGQPPGIAGRAGRPVPPPQAGAAGTEPGTRLPLAEGAPASLPFPSPGGVPHSGLGEAGQHGGQQLRCRSLGRWGFTPPLRLASVRQAALEVALARSHSDTPKEKQARERAQAFIF